MLFSLSSLILSHSSLCSSVSGSVQYSTLGSERIAKTDSLSVGERGRRRRRSVVIVSLARFIAGDDMVDGQSGANGKVFGNKHSLEDS